MMDTLLKPIVGYVGGQMCLKDESDHPCVSHLVPLHYFMHPSS